MRFLMVAVLMLFVFAGRYVCAAADGDPVVYDDKGKRDPFVPLIGNVSSKVTSVNDVMTIDDVQFQGVAKNAQGKNCVLINGELIKQGDTVGAVSVIEVSDQYIVLSIQGNEYTLEVSDYE